MKRKALFIGGTGTISTAITAQLAAEGEWELTLLNRGTRSAQVPAGTQWDCVCDFIGFVPAQVERDWRLFRGRTKQYMYISSASAYQKPLESPVITEGTPLVNPYWEYSRNKIACEDFLMGKFREEGYPVTIIRTLTHNTDFAKGFVGLMGNPHAIGDVFHITSDDTLTWNQIYQTIADALNVPLKAVHVSSEFLDAVGPYDYRGGLLGDKANTVLFDNRKLKRAVPGFKATVRFDQGVRRTIGYILAHPECQQEDPAFDAWCDRVIAAVEAAKASLR